MSMVYKDEISLNPEKKVIKELNLGGIHKKRKSISLGSQRSESDIPDFDMDEFDLGLFRDPKRARQRSTSRPK